MANNTVKLTGDSWSDIPPGSTDDLKEVLQANGIFDRSDMLDTIRFNKYGYFDLYNRVGQTKEYVFFTKPDLYIQPLHQGTNIPEFQDAVRQGYPCLRDLQLGLNKSEPFSAILYNHRASNLDLPDLDSSDIDTAENMWGQKIFYRGSSASSNDGYDFSMEFTDNKYRDVYDFFRLYDLYEQRKAYGVINLAEYNATDYIYHKKLHDQFSIFKFIVGEDGKELISWFKFIGVYPKNVPRSSYGDMPEDGNFKFTVQFKANHIDDLNPNIITDFNELSGKYGGQNVVNKYVVGQGYMKNNFGAPPFIRATQSRNGRGMKYELQWRD